MNNPASDWLVLIRPLLAGFEVIGDNGKILHQRIVCPVVQVACGVVSIRQLFVHAPRAGVSPHY
jgi:hypothetical protein